MKIRGKSYRTVWMEGRTVCLLDQNALPFRIKIHRAKTAAQTCRAICDMTVRGAGAIGAAAAFAMAQVFLEAPAKGFWSAVRQGRRRIARTRPTAQNLFYGVNRVFFVAQSSKDPRKAALEEACFFADEEVEAGRKIGIFGSKLIRNRMRILTHCNAGWLAFVDYGSALAPVYAASSQKKKVFVYADETRPRGQGARLTAFELGEQGIEHAIVADNAAAHLMAHGLVDAIIVGADRIAANGDTANKIGTLEKAIVAKAFGVPFYVAAPLSTFDLKCRSGKAIPIEARSQDEVLYQTGPTRKGRIETIRVAAPGSGAVNPAFDVTPAKYIKAFITPKGIVRPSRAALARLK